MRARVAASLTALVILVTGVIPAVGGYRCVATGMRMQAVASCCRHDDAARAWKGRCCEATGAPRVEPRQAPSSADTAIPPPALVAWIIFPPIAPATSGVDLTTTGRARGRPLGDELHLLSTVLRV